MNTVEKTLGNVSDLMLASASHYEILEGDRFGSKFAPITKVQFVCFFLCGGRGAREHSTIDLLVCLGFIIKNSHGPMLKTS